MYYVQHQQRQIKKICAVYLFFECEGILKDKRLRQTITNVLVSNRNPIRLREHDKDKALYDNLQNTVEDESYFKNVITHLR